MTQEIELLTKECQNSSRIFQKICLKIFGSRQTKKISDIKYLLLTPVIIIHFISTRFFSTLQDFTRYCKNLQIDARFYMILQETTSFYKILQDYTRYFKCENNHYYKSQKNRQLSNSPCRKKSISHKNLFSLIPIFCLCFFQKSFSKKRRNICLFSIILFEKLASNYQVIFLQHRL